MTRDEWLTVTLVVAFATLVTAHVTLVVGLLARQPRWRAAGRRPRASARARSGGCAPACRAGPAVWMASAIAYGVVRWLASR